MEDVRERKLKVNLGASEGHNSLTVKPKKGRTEEGERSRVWVPTLQGEGGGEIGMEIKPIS